MPHRVSEERTGKEMIDPQFPRFLQEEFAGVVARVESLRGRNPAFEPREAGRHPGRERRGRCRGGV